MRKIKCLSGIEVERVVEIHIDEFYIVTPMNPAIRKDSGRRCRLLEYNPWGKNDGDVRVEWQDNKRESWICACDLVSQNK